MRSDMDEVLIERPRAGARLPRRERKWRGRWTEPEEFPRQLSMSRHRGGTKHLTDNLGPLRRFLRSRVGRPWDEVYGEVRRQLSPRRHLDIHILEHLKHEVPLEVYRQGDQVFHLRFGAPWPLRGGQLYVCPETGVLCSTAFRKRHQRAM